MISIASVTVWFNPQNMDTPTASQAVTSYSSRMGKIYIVDNSDSDNHELAEKIPNSVYIPNHKNLGIATALNIGCNLALKDGFEWVMTMDQDSYFDSDQLDNYLKFFEENYSLDNTIHSFAPSQNDEGLSIIPITAEIKRKVLSPIKHFIFRNKPQKKAAIQPEKEFVDRIMASANIINLKTWDKLGRFDDILFIDEVDHYYCTRLILADYKILRTNTFYVNHRLGNPKRTFLPKVQYESDFRLFYIFRNLLIEKHRFEKVNKYRNYKKEIWEYFRDYCILDFHFITHLDIFFRAYKDYKKIIKR